MIVFCGVMLPLAHLQAATYGGFAPGKTFTFTVTSRTSVQTKGTKVTTNAPIPAGIPNYSKGQKVKFTIGSKGQLTGPGLSMPFKSGSATANTYVNPPTSTFAQPNSGIVFKNSLNKPTGVTLHFFKVELSGFTLTSNTVVYTLE